ncbi:MAG: orotate phosphoribosyltransferase, partial [Polaromonas sp.]|nr:orotate phosphoribosyltransferase [Polaromonas sp.]
ARQLLAEEQRSGLAFDMIFGPAYKGIPLAAAVAIELARLGRNLPFAYNRKEAKAHGEGGSLVGAPLKGRVLIVDDVMSAGTAVRESIALIQAAGATPHAVAIALDRQEKATENGLDVNHSAVQYVTEQLGLQVCAIARLSDLLQYLALHSSSASGGEASGAQLLKDHYQSVLAYRERYGVN